MTQHTQLICKNAVLGYDNHVVTKEINFTINRGDYLCIVGKNGSGKTTLAKTILGFIPPVLGEINWCGGNRPKIGYLPQQTTVQKDFPASVYEIVISGCASGKKGVFFTKKDKATAIRNMEKLNIVDLKNSPFRNLSGGQKQRVLLARALCSAEDILLLDEPVSGLDPAAANDLYEVIHKLNKDENITVIIVSHDIDASLKYSSHILQIDASDFFFGSCEEYKNSDIGRSYIKLGGCDGGCDNV